MTHTKREWVLCRECGGDRIQETAWFYVNDDPIVLVGDPPTDQIYCDACDAEVDTVIVFESDDGKFWPEGKPEMVFDTREEAWAAYS